MRKFKQKPDDGGTLTAPYHRLEPVDATIFR